MNRCRIILDSSQENLTKSIVGGGGGGEGSELPDSVESDLGCTSRIYIDFVTLTLHNMTLKSQKPCQDNNKRDCSKTNGYK